MNQSLPEQTVVAHQLMVAKLAKPGSDIISTLTPPTMHLLHMAVGISGEVGELIETFSFNTRGDELLRTANRTNTVEELGDLHFYIEGAYQGLGVSAIEVTEHAIYTDNIWHLVICTSQFLDQVKKAAIYNKELERDKTMICLDKVHAMVHNIGYSLQIPKQEVLQANIDKLDKKRYKDGYSDAAAQARADKISESNEKAKTENW